MPDGMYSALALLPESSDFTLAHAVAHFDGMDSDSSTKVISPPSDQSWNSQNATAPAISKSTKMAKS